MKKIISLFILVIFLPSCATMQGGIIPQSDIEKETAIASQEDESYALWEEGKLLKRRISELEMKEEGLLFEIQQLKKHKDNLASDRIYWGKDIEHMTGREYEYLKFCLGDKKKADAKLKIAKVVKERWEWAKVFIVIGVVGSLIVAAAQE